jgi:hypothetical protein
LCWLFFSTPSITSSPPPFYKAEFGEVEDAVTGRRLSVADQLLYIKTRTTSDKDNDNDNGNGNDQADINNVPSLLDFVYAQEEKMQRECQVNKPRPVLIMAGAGTGETRACAGADGVDGVGGVGGVGVAALLIYSCSYVPAMLHTHIHTHTHM